MSQITIPSDKGITAHPIKLKIKVKLGAIKKIFVLVLVGKVVSLVNNFKPSAKGCVSPIKPITLGPLRLWIAPIIFLSAIVKYATAINNGITKLKIFKIVIKIKFNIIIL